MRRILYAAILLSLLFVPVDKLDVAKLLPVESVAVYLESGEVVLKTNTENAGRGVSVSAALENLKEVTPAVVYLDTAKYLLVSEDATAYVDDLRQYLKPSVGVAVCDAKNMIKDAARYFGTHGGTVELRHWETKRFRP